MAFFTHIMAEWADANYPMLVAARRHALLEDIPPVTANLGVIAKPQLISQTHARVLLVGDAGWPMHVSGVHSRLKRSDNI